MAIIDSGTVAAVVPMAVPMRKTTKSRNGKERMVFTNKFNTEKTIRFSYICPFLHRKSNVPTGSPTITAAAIETPTMMKVSPIERQISASY